MKARDQHFGLERADALRRKIDDADHLADDQLILAVEHHELRARLAHADLGPEIDAQLPRGLARLGKIEHFENGADAQLDALEIRPLNGLHAAGVYAVCGGGPTYSAVGRISLLSCL